MHRRSLIIGAATAALAISALAAPVAAANPTVAFVNGIPGKTVDVCVGNQEVKSGLRYGKWVARSVPDGSRTIRFRQASPGACQGNLLGQVTDTFDEDANYTVVGTAKSPDKVLVFTNSPLPTTLSGDWVAFVRHAADVGNVLMHVESTGVITPSVVPETFSKGDQFRDQDSADFSNYITATKLTSMEPLAGPKHFTIIEGRWGEIYLVGSKPSNARFVTIYRPLPLPIIIFP